MRSLLRKLKDAVWGVIAFISTTGARQIRRRPGPRTADEWRATSVSYSHYAEDLIVLHLLRVLGRVGGEKGIYIDVGAFDPILCSNTLLLRMHGWRGVNVEANPLRVGRIARLRPDDVTLAAVVSDREREVIYLHYPTEGTNRLIEVEDQNRANVFGELPIREDRMKAVRLDELLRGHVPPGAKIDFLNVDCEGEDLGVLRSFDWADWHPAVVAVEAYDDESRAAVRTFLGTHGYTVVAQAILTLIFVKQTPLSDLRPFS